MAEALQVFRLVGKRLFAAADQQLLTATVQDGVVNDLELAKLADELDVPQHLLLRQHAGRTIIIIIKKYMRN